MESQSRMVEFVRDRRRLEKQYPEHPKVVYLGSPYRSGRGEHGVDMNIAVAKELGRKIWKLGLAVLNPVVNTAHYGGIDVPDKVWLVGDFALLRRCDALVLHPDWETSSGCRAERDLAVDLGLPVFYLMDQWRHLASWAKKTGNGDNGTPPYQCTGERLQPPSAEGRYA